MNRRIFVIGMALFLCAIEAGVASANVYMADTSDYDETNGKKILIYGDIIKDVTISWKNVDNISQHRTETHEDINDSSYLYTIDEIWNASFIQYELTVLNFNNDVFFFSGGFSTVISKGDLTDYHKIENMVEEIVNDSSNTLKSDMTMWLLGNASFKKHFSDVKEGAIDSISTYIEGFVTELQNLGYSDTQIEEMKEVIAAGYQSTVRTEKEQNLEIARAEGRGWWEGVKFIAIFLVVASIVVFLWMFIKGYIGLSSPWSKKPRSTKISDDLNLDLFDLK